MGCVCGCEGSRWSGDVGGRSARSDVRPVRAGPRASGDRIASANPGVRSWCLCEGVCGCQIWLEPIPNTQRSLCAQVRGRLCFCAVGWCDDRRQRSGPWLCAQVTAHTGWALRSNPAVTWSKGPSAPTPLAPRVPRSLSRSHTPPDWDWDLLDRATRHPTTPRRATTPRLGLEQPGGRHHLDRPHASGCVPLCALLSTAWHAWHGHPACHPCSAGRAACRLARHSPVRAASKAMQANAHARLAKLRHAAHVRLSTPGCSQASRAATHGRPSPRASRVARAKPFASHPHARAQGTSTRTMER